MIYTTVNQIRQLYPSLVEQDFCTPLGGTISLQDDSDGKGSYIKEWTNSNSMPTQEQIDELSK